MEIKLRKFNVMLFLEQDAKAREWCVVTLDDEGYVKEIYHWKTKQVYMLDAIKAMNPKTAATMPFR